MSFSDYVFVGSLKEIGFAISVEPNTFDKLNFINSTVSKNGENIFDEVIRSSKICRRYDINLRTLKYGGFTNISMEIIKKIKPIQYNLDCSIGCFFDIVKYEEGDHFNKFHYDTFINKNVATILIFPPGNYTGGDLVFKIDNQEHVVKTSEFTTDTCVIFGNVLHKCTPVTSGIRYVCKGIINATLPNILSDVNKFKLESINLAEISKLAETTKSDKKSIMTEEIIKNHKHKIEEIIDEYYQMKIENIKQSINEDEPSEDIDSKEYDTTELEDISKKFKLLINELERLKKNNMESSSHYIYDYPLETTKYNICVLPYFISSMNDFSEYDISTLKYIKQLITNGWNVTSMYEIFTFETKHGECEELDDLDFFDNAEGKDHYEYDYGNRVNSKYEIHFNKKKVKNGYLIDDFSEYNDEGGFDKYKKFKCSCLLVWKD